MKGQSHKHSIIEALTNLAVGILIALIIYAIFIPTLSIPIRISLTAIFSTVSVFRIYIIRRLFNKRLIKKRKQLIYLATPYSHKTKKMREDRESAVTILSGALDIDKHFNYSPITIETAVRRFFRLPTDWDDWREQDTNAIDHCDEVWVFTLDGFKKSRGVTAEIKYTKHLGKPLKYIRADINKNGQVIYNVSNFPPEKSGTNAKRFVDKFMKHSSYAQNNSLCTQYQDSAQLFVEYGGGI